VDQEIGEMITRRINFPEHVVKGERTLPYRPVGSRGMIVPPIGRREEKRDVPDTLEKRIANNGIGFVPDERSIQAVEKRAYGHGHDYGH
jgi:hypothetical protein